jgi:hypothetical protein
MMADNRVYRSEDIDDLSNSDFGSYDIFLWRGSYNCRHQWVKLTYKKEGRIINNGNSTRGLEETDGLGTVRQPDTRTESTINSRTPQNQWRPGVPRTGNFAESKGLEDACWEGYEPIGLKDDGSPNCVPIKMTEDDFAESITDYPEGVKNAAQKAVDYAEKNGWGSCGTAVGKTRASQLANGEAISVDTLKRM